MADLRTVVSPEGVPLPFEIASPIDRAAALFIDLVIVHSGLLLTWLVAAFFGAAGFGGHALTLFYLASFVLRNAYFPWCEIRFGGSTPGKRLLRLRVVSRDGGALQAESVLARNLTRDFEIFLPVVALVRPELLLPGLPGWAALLGVVWLLAGALLPFFNRDHLRLGDMLGGTLVVRVPDARLLEELTGEAPEGAEGAGPGREWAFTSEQLEVYGIQELQTLEQILRRGPAGEGENVGRAVARRIQEKIAWPLTETDEQAWPFLTAFYRQLRAHLEHKALFGVRQEHKREGKLARRGAANASTEAPATPADPPPTPPPGSPEPPAGG